MQRASGRTYRKILSACLAASHGQKVLFLCGNPTEVENILRSIKPHLPVGCKSPNKTFFPFPGGGSIELRTGESLRGSRYDKLVTDEMLGLTWRDIEPILETAKTTLN